MILSKLDPDFARKKVFELKIDENLFNIVKNINKNLNSDWDNVFCISGSREGIGKSTLAMLIGYMITEDFDLEKNISYLPTYDEIEKKFQEIPQKSILDIDEAIRVFYKLNWMSRLQQRLVEMYATERKQNKATSLNIPRVTDLTENFRNHKVHIWIQIVSRGYAVVFSRDYYNIASKDPWHLKETEKLLEKLRGNRRVFQMTNEDMSKAYEKVPGYICDFVFPDLPEIVKEEYKRIGLLKRQQKIDMDQEEVRMIAIRLRETGMEQKTIAKLLGRDESTVSRWMNGLISN